MQTFIEAISIVGAIVGTVVTLTLFYRGLAWLMGEGSNPETISVRGVLTKETLATIHLAGGRKFDRVRFVGFTNTESVKTRLPHELRGMVILEDEQRQRYLVRAKDIQMVVIAPEASAV